MVLLGLSVALIGCGGTPPPPSANTDSSLEATAGVESSATTVPATELMAKKPVIYLYPEREQLVRVALAVDGRITHTEPRIGADAEWQVLAAPSGRLVDTVDRATYPYLFWEADMRCDIDMSTGFVVPGSDTRRFLEQKLDHLGLASHEAQEFIDYWLPQMQGNAFNVIHFAGSTYTDAARLEIDPRPDSVIRVFMAFQPVPREVDITPQILTRPPDREGFTIVEWGGAQLPARR